MLSSICFIFIFNIFINIVLCVSEILFTIIITLIFFYLTLFYFDVYLYLFIVVSIYLVFSRH